MPLTPADFLFPGLGEAAVFHTGHGRTLLQRLFSVYHHSWTLTTEIGRKTAAVSRLIITETAGAVVG
jgi:hypothetical protein